MLGRGMRRRAQDLRKPIDYKNRQKQSAARNDTRRNRDKGESGTSKGDEVQESKDIKTEFFLLQSSYIELSKS